MPAQPVLVRARYAELVDEHSNKFYAFYEIVDAPDLAQGAGMFVTHWGRRGHTGTFQVHRRPVTTCSSALARQWDKKHDRGYRQAIVPDPTFSMQTTVRSLAADPHSLGAAFLAKMSADVEDLLGELPDVGDRDQLVLLRGAERTALTPGMSARLLPWLASQQATTDPYRDITLLVTSAPAAATLRRLAHLFTTLEATSLGIASREESDGLLDVALGLLDGESDAAVRTAVAAARLVLTEN